jgi:hypothetical protein
VCFAGLEKLVVGLKDPARALDQGAKICDLIDQVLQHCVIIVLLRAAQWCHAIVGEGAERIGSGF